jgi:ABC-type multidrug transport system fused ATPase/permease subunit
MLVFLTASFLEVLGIGLILPFIELMSNPNAINEIAIIKWFYTSFNFQSINSFFITLGLLIVVVYCVRSGLYFLSYYYIRRFCNTQRGHLFIRLLQSYLYAPYTFHLRKNSASFIQNITLETFHFHHYCLLPLLNGFSNFLILAVLIGILIKTSAYLLIMLLIAILPVLLIFYNLKDQFKKWGKQSSNANQEMIQILSHGIGGIKETKVIGCESYFLDLMQQQVKKYVVADTLSHSFQGLPRILIETLLVIVVMVYISTSQVFFQQSFQEITASLAVFTIAAIRLIPASSQLISAASMLQSGNHAVQMLYADLSETEQEIKSQFSSKASNEKFKSSNLIPSIEFLPDSQTETKLLNTIGEKIEIINLSYQYPHSKNWAIENINLKINRGNSIGLIGKSGAGKTTLVDVLLGLLRPTNGDIKVNGLSVYQDLRKWQKLIGYIPQSIFLMDDTIENNIAFGVPHHLIDQEQLNKAIDLAQLRELVDSLPEGIYTSVGERGVRLSGGQRQRVGIARSLYHMREILILDEATSALDNETEKLISQSIDSLARTKTLIIIAHRLSTIQKCDQIYVLEQGKLTQSGKYNEVVRDK